jgi:hypothetical protein
MSHTQFTVSLSHDVLLSRLDAGNTRCDVATSAIACCDIKKHGGGGDVVGAQ